MKPSPRNPPTLIVSLLCLLILGVTTQLPSLTHAQGQVQVTAADPATTEQGTLNLNVRVTGKGFKNGARAQWFVTGTTNPGGVTVNYTTFVSSTELNANITVDDAATIANFDIQVLNSDGRGGKGTELFAITAKGQAACPPVQPAPASDSKCYDFASGCFDTTFGGGIGFVTTDLPTPGEGAWAVEMQPDGKIVVAAQVQSTSTGWDFAVLRYNTDGTLDTSFGDPNPLNPLLRLGYTVTAITSGSDSAQAVLLQPDGRIVVAGGAGTQDMSAVRYNVDGTRDSSFGSGGIVRVSFTNNKYVARAYDVGQQADGKLVLFGTANGQFSLARLNTNGSLDSSFGSSGKLSINASGSRNGTSSGRSLAFQRVPAVTGEEKIIVGGLSSISSTGSNSDWTLMRLRPDGSTDTTFGTAGIVRTDFTGLDDRLSQIKLDSSNRIVAVGNINSGSSCGNYVVNSALVRYTENGNLDGSFTGGKQVVDLYGGMDNISGLAFQADGKILTFGSAYNAFTSSSDRILHLSLIRFNVDGTRDASFGLLGNGVVTMDLTANGGDGLAIVVQPIDGKLVGVGAVGSNMFVSRYLP